MRKDSESIFKSLKTFYLVDRYIFSEFFSAFLFSLCLFLIITISGFVLFNLIDLMVKYGISISLFLKLFLYSIPEMVFYSLPMSVLLACILSAGRLYRDNEVTIFQASGRSNIRLFLPIFLFAIFLSLLALFFNYFIVSKANNELSKGYFYAQMKKDIPIAKQNIFYKDFEKGILKRSFYAREFINSTMYDPIVEEFNDGQITSIIQAKKSILVNGKWIFKQGVIYNISEKKYNSSLKFDNYSFSFLPQLENVAGEIRTPKEMNYLELSSYIKSLKISGTNTSALEVQLYQKISIPLTSSLFFLVGIPLGLNKKSKTSSFAFTFSLFFIFGYYTLMFACTALGSTNTLNPIIASWLPDILTLIFGCILFKKI